MEFTEEEIAIINEYMNSLSPVQKMAVVMQYVPILIKQGLISKAPIQAYLSARSSKLAADISTLDTTKDSEETRLSNIKSAVDGLATKLSGG